MSVDIWTLVIAILIVISIVVAITSSYISGKMENEYLKAHFDKLSEDYYKDDEETTFHVPISFFISSVSTVSFVTVIALFVTKNKAFFTENIPYVGIYFFYIILIFLGSIIVHEFFVSFGRLAVTIGKRTKKAATALVLIIWMFVILGISLIVSIALSNYWA